MTRRRLTAAVLAVLALAAAACADEDTIGLDPVTASATDFNTLSAAVSVRTATEATVVVRARSADGHVVTTLPSGPATEHEIIVLGLRPDTGYTLEATATAGGDEATATTDFTSGSIPDHFPVVRVLTSEPAAMAPGLTLLPITSRGGGWPDAPTRPGEPREGGTFLLTALDETGEIVWYLELDDRASDFELTDAGTILYVENQLRVVELSLTGERLRVWEGRSSAAQRNGAPAPDGTILVATDTMHHEIEVLPDGNLLTLSSELVDSGLENLPCESEQDTADGFTVIADTVVVFDPDNGAVVHEWSLADLIDPVSQPGAIVCEPVPFSAWYPDEPAAGDWTHANAVAVDPAGRLLVSVRHLHSVLALDHGDEATRGDLLWQLGPDQDFTLTGEAAAWQYMQHAPEIDDGGRLILYDNGNLRPDTTLPDDETAGDEEPYSRAVIYQLDAETRTATQVWEHRASEDDGTPIYADFVGDADLLGNGNVLVTHGGIVVGGVRFDEELGEDVLFAENKARLIEIVPEGSAGGRTVFDAEVVDGRIGWFVFAAERIPSLYG